jgi:hypothetical protein
MRTPLLVVLVFLRGALVLVVSKHGRLRFRKGDASHSVFQLFTLVALLVFLGLLVIWLFVLGCQFLPLLTELFADLACRTIRISSDVSRVDGMGHTELDAWVVLTNLVAVVVGEEHVCRKTTLWRVGICEVLKLDWMEETGCKPLPFLRLPSTLDLALRALTSLGMIAKVGN